MRVVAAAVLASLILPVEAAGAEGACRAVTKVNRNGQPYQVEVCEGSGERERSGGSTTSGRARRYQASELIRVVSSVDGEPCSIWATRTSVQGRRGIETEFGADVVGEVFDTSVWQVWQDMVAALPGCGLASAADPAEQTAFEFLYTYETPDPEPWIAPGWAITGKPSYLETGGPLTHAPEPVATPLGLLQVQFTATSFTVDWGDASPVEEHPSPGLAWPEGTATHAYVHTGVYDVVVAQRWEASWRLGDRDGQVILTGAPSVIEDFRVDQLQAVRER